MSYYNINIDAIDNMIAEYKTLRETLKNCGDVLSTAVVNLSCDVHIGTDANFLRDNWTIQHRDTIPTIAELLDGVISILEDSSNEYKECKSYCSNMINVFNDYKTVQYSADSMNGYALCDVDSIETAIEYENEIGEDACKNADDIASALEVVAGLNYGQSGLQSALKDLADENVKLTDYSVHAYQLRQYIQKMVEADDHLFDKLVGINISFIGYFDDSFVPSGLVLANCSPEAIKCAMIFSKPAGERTEKEIRFLESMDAGNINFNSSDYMLVMSAIGGKNEDIEWSDVEAKIMANGFVYGLENKNAEIMMLFYTNSLVCTNDGIYFGDKKLTKSMSYIDCDANPTAYFTLVRDSHMMLKNYHASIGMKLECVDDNYVLSIDQYGYDASKNFKVYHTEKLPFINMYDEIPEEALDNIRNGLNMSRSEEIEFLSSFYSDEDVEHLCELASISIGDTDALEKLFSSSVNGVTPHYYTALADYTYHLGEYGTEEYAAELGNVSNTILAVGHTGSIFASKDNASFYLNALSQGYKARFDQANLIAASSYKTSDYDDFVRYGTLHTLYESQKYMYQNGLNSTTILGDIAQDLAYGDYDMHVDLKNVMFCDIKFADDYNITYNVCFETRDDLPEYVDNANISKCFPVTVYGMYTDGFSNKDKILQDMDNIQWKKDMFPYKAVFEISKDLSGYSKIKTYGSFDIAENIINENIKVPTDIGVSKGVSNVTGSVDVVKNLYTEYTSFDKDMQKEYDDYFCNITGWRTGFKIGNDENSDVPLGNFSFDKKESKFVVIREPYSPLGYIVTQEINNGFLVEGLTEEDKRLLEENINFVATNEENRENIRLILYGGFDKEDYLKDHTMEEYTKLYDLAIDAYEIDVKIHTGGETRFEKTIDARKDEIYQEFFN